VIGVFGGTFDPVHFGHLRVARAAFDLLTLDELRFVPANRPPLRDAPVASAMQRAAMVALAIRDEPGFRLDTRELDRGGVSYTVDTLASLRAELGDATLCLLIGQDQFAGFERWHRWPEILELCHLVVLNRPGAPAPNVPGWAQARVSSGTEWRMQPAGKLVFQTVQPQDISATRIRARLAAGESVAEWVPRAVCDYIETSHLYGPVGRS
jgi:nicotinate-nucleotide adenylyltransferase